MRRFLLFVLLTPFVLSCATGPSPTTTPAVPGSEKDQTDPRVGVFVSDPWTFSTSSYWIEGPDGLILIDTQFLPSVAEKFVDYAERTTGKKAVLAIVLHANPDKFNGTGALQRRGIRVVTSEQVIGHMPVVHEKRVRAFYERYKPDYPKELALPESFGSTTTELSAGGIQVKAHVLGAGCSEAHVAVEFDGHVFAGDLVANGVHSWLEIGKTDEWLVRLGELRALHPRRVHPGRGASGGPGLLDEEQRYLETVIQLVSRAQPTLPPPQGAMDAVKKQIRDAYPNHRFPVFLEIGLPAEWRRQARLRAE